MACFLFYFFNTTISSQTLILFVTIDVFLLIYIFRFVVVAVIKNYDKHQTRMIVLSCAVPTTPTRPYK